MSPADVYLLLKSSDFVQHDLSREHVFDGCESKPPSYDLELVLRKWYPVDRSRELRCFVRQEKLLGRMEGYLGEGHALTERRDIAAGPQSL